MVDKKIPYFSMFILIALLTLDYSSAIEQTSIAIERVEPYLSVAEITISRDTSANIYKSYMYELPESTINIVHDLAHMNPNSIYSKGWSTVGGFNGDVASIVQIVNSYLENNNLRIEVSSQIEDFPVESRIFIKDLTERGIIRLNEQTKLYEVPESESHNKIITFNEKENPVLLYDKIRYLTDPLSEGQAYVHELFHSLFGVPENSFIPNEDPSKRVDGLAKTIWDQFPKVLKEVIIKTLELRGYTYRVIEQQIGENEGGSRGFYEEAINVFFIDRTIFRSELEMVELLEKNLNNREIRISDIDAYIQSLHRGDELIEFRDKVLKQLSEDVIQLDQSIEHARRNNQIYSQIFGSEIKMSPEEIGAYQYLLDIRSDGIAGPETRRYFDLLDKYKNSEYYSRWVEDNDVVQQAYDAYTNSPYFKIVGTHLSTVIPLLDAVFIYAHRDDMKLIVDSELAKNYNDNPNYQEYRGVFEDYLILIGKSPDEISEIMANPDKIKKYQLMVEAFPDGKIGPETAARALEAMGKEYEARTIAAQQELNNLLQEDFDFHNIQIRGADSPIISQEEMDAWLNQQFEQLPVPTYEMSNDVGVGDYVVHYTSQTVGRIPVVGGILTGGVNIIVGAAEAVGGFFENLWDSVVGESQTGDLALCAQICSSSNCESIGESWGCKCIYSCTPQGCMCYAQYSGT